MERVGGKFKMTRRGVYVLELNSGRFYVGSSGDIDSRVAQHGNSPVVGGHGGIFRVHPPMAPHNQNQRAGKKVLSEATEMYPRGITRPCKQKTDARIGIRVPLANSTRKNRGKNGGFCGGAPGRDANLYSDLSKPIFGERDPTRDTSKITGQKRAWCKA